MVVNSLRKSDWLISDPKINDAAFLIFSNVHSTKIEIDNTRRGNRMKMRILEPAAVALSYQWAIKDLND